MFSFIKSILGKLNINFNIKKSGHKAIVKDSTKSSVLQAGRDIIQITDNQRKDEDIRAMDRGVDSAVVTYEIASVLPNRPYFDFLKDWKVWFLIKNHEKKKYKAYVKIKFISGDYEEEAKSEYYGGIRAWNLNALTGIVAPGLGISKKIKEKAKQKKKIEIRISCEIRDENDELIEKKLPVGYVYDYKNNNWYLEP